MFIKLIVFIIMKFNIKKITPFILSGVLLVSCGSNENSDKQEIDKNLLDPTNSLKTDFDGKIFSIPSPIQMALLLKETNAPFNQELLGNSDNSSKYSSEYKQALNLGITGADLGYASINNQNSATLNCLSKLEYLINKLGLDGMFDKSLTTRFEKNKTNTDSVLVIVSEAFRNGDNYLKKKKRKHTSSLILTGGWIESIYFACEINKTSKNNKITERIAEQQQTLTTVIEILNEYNTENENDELIKDLTDLKVSFDQIKIDYNFVAPKTDQKNKITTIQHTTTVKVDDKILKEITEKIISIREKIIN